MTENHVISLEEIEASARLDDVTEPHPSMPEEPADLGPDQREAIAHMVRQAKDAGIALTGPDGLLKALTAQIAAARAAAAADRVAATRSGTFTPEEDALVLRPDLRGIPVAVVASRFPSCVLAGAGGLGRRDRG